MDVNNVAYVPPSGQPGALDTPGPTQLFTLGAVFESADGKKYRYIKYVDASGGGPTIAAGAPVGFANGNDFEVTGDLSDVTMYNFAGLAQGALTTTNCYGWVQFEGPFSAGLKAASDGGIAANAPVYWSADLALGTATLGTHWIVGYCRVVADTAATTFSGYLYGR